MRLLLRCPLHFRACPRIYVLVVKFHWFLWIDCPGKRNDLSRVVALDCHLFVRLLTRPMLNKLLEQILNEKWSTKLTVNSLFACKIVFSSCVAIMLAVSVSPDAVSCSWSALSKRSRIVFNLSCSSFTRSTRVRSPPPAADFASSNKICNFSWVAFNFDSNSTSSLTVGLLAMSCSVC